MTGSLVGETPPNSPFGRDYFQKSSTYKKFSGTDRAVAGLSNYYYGLYCLIGKYFPKDNMQNTKVLEIGCGYSGLVNHFISAGYNYTGLDISGFIVSELRQKYPGINFIQCDIQKPLDLDYKFDLVVGLEVLEHVPKPLEALRNISDVLSNGGLFIATVPNPKSRIPFTDWRKDPTHISIMQEGNWVSLFSLAGFNKVASTTIFTVPYFWHLNKVFSKVFTIPKFGASILLLGRK